MPWALNSSHVYDKYSKFVCSEQCPNVLMSQSGLVHELIRPKTKMQSSVHRPLLTVVFTLFGDSHCSGIYIVRAVLVLRSILQLSPSAYFVQMTQTTDDRRQIRA